MLVDLSTNEVLQWARSCLPQDASYKLEGVKGEILASYDVAELKEDLGLNNIQWASFKKDLDRAKQFGVAPIATPGDISSSHCSPHTEPRTPHNLTNPTPIHAPT